MPLSASFAMHHTDSSPSITNTVTWLACALLLMATATFVWQRGGPWPGGADSSGYFNNSRLLLEGKAHEELRHPEGLDLKVVNAWTFTPLGMRPVGEPPVLAPTYPVGLPLHLATGFLIFGKTIGPRVVLTAIAVFAIAATLWTLRLCGIGRLWTLLSGTLLVSNAVFLIMALWPMSDVLALAWCAMAFSCALKSRNNFYWALACGASVGIAVLVRPSNCLIVLPVLILLGADWRRLGLLILGGLPFALFLGVYQQTLYGSALETGYGNVASAFSTSFVATNLQHFALWFGRTLGWITPLFVIPGLLIGNAPARVRLALGTWIAIFIGFYSTCEFSDDAWWSLRYLLPIYPPILAGAALFGERLVGWSVQSVPLPFAKFGELAVTLSLFAIGMIISISWSRELSATSIGDGESVYPDTATWMRGHLPPGAAILCMQVSGALLYSTPYTLIRYDTLNEEQWAYVRHWHQERNVPLYAVVFPFEYSDQKVLEHLVPGDWSQIGNVRHVRIYQLKD